MRDVRDYLSPRPDGRGERNRPESRPPPLRGLRPFSEPPPEGPRPRARGDPLARSTVTLKWENDKQGEKRLNHLTCRSNHVDCRDRDHDLAHDRPFHDGLSL